VPQHDNALCSAAEDSRDISDIRKKLLYQESAFIRVFYLERCYLRRKLKIEFVNKALHVSMNQLMIQHKDPESFL
jgi:hypothetical protein